VKKFTCFIASALALTCAVSAVPTAVYADSESNKVSEAVDISGHEIPHDYDEALNFYNEIGEISYCKCGQIVTCIPTVKSNSSVEYYLNGEKLEPENIKRNFCPITTDTDGNLTDGYNGFESISFFPKEVNKKYTLEINTLYTVKSDIPSEPLPLAFNESYKFEFEVDENGIITPQDPCINPATYQQSEVFMEKYGNYTAFDNKVIVCTPRFIDGGYDAVYKSNAELLSEENFSRFFYYIDNETGESTEVPPGGQTNNKVLIFDASKEGTYNVEVCNKREWEDEKQNVISFTYTVDESGNVEFNKSEPVSTPEYIRSFQDADTIFKENRGYLNNDNYTMQIVLPAGKEEYKAECTRDDLLLLNDLYTDGDNGYYVYTYGINYLSLYDGINLGFDIFEEGEEFSMRFTSGDDLYKFKFRYENGNVINIGIVDPDSGDANNDGKIDSADVVTVASYVGNPEKNTISDKAVNLCDVHNTGDGITASDVLMIQQYLAKTVTEF